MATNVVNKAAEVRWWIERQHHGILPGTDEIEAYIKQRWPDLDVDIRSRIARLIAPSPAADH